MAPRMLIVMVLFAIMGTSYTSEVSSDIFKWNARKPRELARLFESTMCQAAMGDSEFKEELWLKMCDTSTVQGNETFQCEEGLQRVAGFKYGNNRLCYSENMVVNGISNILFGNFGVPETNLCSDVSKRKNSDVFEPAENEQKYKSTLLVSLVRDPFSAALHSYLEVRHRSVPGSVQSQLFESIFGEISTNSCTSFEEATSDFKKYLMLLQEKRPLGVLAHYSFPQALKLDRPTSNDQRPRYDLIGHFESLENDLSDMRKSFSRKGDLKHRFLSPSNTTRSSIDAQDDARSAIKVHDDMSCSFVNRKDIELQRMVCQLYLVDYACFGYKMPPACIDMEMLLQAAVVTSREDRNTKSLADLVDKDSRKSSERSGERKRMNRRRHKQRPN